MRKQSFIALLRHNDGATVLEYAIILPILLLLVMGIIEYSLILFASAAMSGAITNAARASQTGYVMSGQTQLEYIDNAVRSRLRGFLSEKQLKNLQIYATSYNCLGEVRPAPRSVTEHCTNIISPDPKPDGYPPPCPEDTGEPSETAVYHAQYPWPVSTPMLRSFLRNGGPSGIYYIFANSVVQNAPSSDNPPSCP